jgi:hypothetical protein
VQHTTSLPNTARSSLSGGPSCNQVRDKITCLLSVARPDRKGEGSMSTKQAQDVSTYLLAPRQEQRLPLLDEFAATQPAIVALVTAAEAAQPSPAGK